MDMDKVIEQLEFIRNYNRLVGNNKTADITNDAIELLKEQAERIKTLEHQLEAITKWRANAGANKIPLKW